MSNPKLSHDDLCQLMTANSADGILSFDHEFRYLSWNPAMEKIAAVPASEVLGKVAWEIFPFLKDIGEDQYFKLAVQGQTAISIQRPFTIPSTGKTGYFEGYYSPLKNRDGIIIGGMATIRDVTARAKQIAEDELFRNIVESVPQIMWVSDADFDVLYYNERWYQYTGLDPKTSTGRELWEKVVHPDDMPRLMNIAERVHADGSTFEAEYRLRGKNGEYRWFFGRAETIPNFSGNPFRRIGTAIDIHEKKLAEQEKTANAERFRILVEQMPFSFQLFKKDGTAIYANAAWEQLWQSRREDLYGGNILADPVIQQTPDYPLVVRAFEGERVTLSDLYFDPKSIGKEGRPRWCRAHMFPVIGENNEFQIASMTEDVTLDIQIRERNSFMSEASRILTQYLDVEELLSNIAQLCVSKIGDLCIFDLVDSDQKLVRSEVAASLSGQEERIARIKKLSPNLEEADHPPVKAFLTQKTVHLSPDPDGKWIRSAKISNDRKSAMTAVPDREIVSIPLVARGHSLGVMTVTCIQGSSRKLTQSEVIWLEELGERAAVAIDNANLYSASKQAVVARDTFLSTASHELKTPLTALQLQLEVVSRLILSHLDSPDVVQRAKTFSLQSDRQIKRLSRLVDDMLDISRIASGKLKVEPESLNLTELCYEVCEKLRPLAGDYGASIACDCSEAAPVYGEWDGVRLEQVMNNLLTNAFRYGGTKPIEVRVREKDGFAFITVRDWGRGIAKENQERIFERFERGEMKNDPSGFGLGLYIAREIVSLHHGTIQVESTLGQGAKFTVRLPLSPPA